MVDSAVAERPSNATSDARPRVAVDDDFDRRWSAWVARGRVHDRRVRRRFFASAAVIAIGSVIAFAFLA
jgi:hypothetical protein